MSDRPAALRRPAAGASAERSAPITAAAWVPAAVALALFAAVGVAVLDDYGMATDEGTQRRIGLAAVNHVLGADTGVLPSNLKFSDRYYGVAFEAPLILVERVLGLTDSRAIYLSRHLLTHLFFLTGGWFCYLLAYRLFGDRWLALFALLLFLLHPRIYAHSFINSKDLPFLAMFMIALYLVQHAFRRDTVAAFALCGAGVGVLINLRVMGLALFAAVPALRALDLVQARGGPARRPALAGAAAFALAAAGTYYAISPYLWRDPAAIVDVVTTLARHPFHPTMLFQGERVRWPFIPAHYLPTWMAITTPPATLLLGLIGVAAVLARGIARPRRALGNSAERFALLLIACLALPAAAVVALGASISSLFDGWRHLYFLYAPLCLLAVCGLRWLLAAARRRGRLQRGMIYLLAAAALAGIAAAGVRLHPHQALYFNFLVDRRTPERLRTQYEMLSRGTEYREGLEYLLARVPDADATLHVDGTTQYSRYALARNRLILPAAARRRIVLTGDRGPAPDFFFGGGFNHRPFGPVLFYERRTYHNTVLAVTTVDLSRVDQATADRYRAAYQATVAGAPLLRMRSQFDLYLDLHGRTVTWIKEPCRTEDTLHPFVLRAVRPAAEQPPWEKVVYGVRFDGRCMIRRRLPDFPFRTFEVGRSVPGAGYVIEAAIDLLGAEPAVRRHWPDNRYWQAHAAITTGERGAPAARAAFDLYLDAAGATLTFHREACAPADLQARFFLHLFPVDAADLPAEHRPHGFHNRSFDWEEHGRVLGSACVAIAPLPAWESGIAHIRTGQFTSGQGQLWGVEFPTREASGE